jgi:predicted nicotinamide N-methyase
LELGCGAGLASSAAARLGASSVIATNANREVPDLARRNTERNDSSNVVRTASFHWGLLDASEYKNVADVVIGSDLTYNSRLWVALAETMLTVLKSGGIVIYLFLGYAGFNVGGEVSGFVSMVGNMGL